MNNKISFKTFGLINIFSVMHINILSLAKELEINKRKFHKKAFAKKKITTAKLQKFMVAYYL